MSQLWRMKVECQKTPKFSTFFNWITCMFFTNLLDFFVRLLLFHAMKLRNNWEVSKEVLLFPFIFFILVKQYYITDIIFSFQCKHLIFREISLISYLCKHTSNYRPQSNITILLPSPDDIWETGKFISFVGEITLSCHKLFKKKKRQNAKPAQSQNYSWHPCEIKIHPQIILPERVMPIKVLAYYVFIC